jgi:hypothetical protein
MTGASIAIWAHHRSLGWRNLVSSCSTTKPDAHRVMAARNFSGWGGANIGLEMDYVDQGVASWTASDGKRRGVQDTHTAQCGPHCSLYARWPFPHTGRGDRSLQLQYPSASQSRLPIYARATSGDLETDLKEMPFCLKDPIHRVVQ